jgi:hypothetical protein
VQARQTFHGAIVTSVTRKRAVAGARHARAPLAAENRPFPSNTPAWSSCMSVRFTTLLAVAALTLGGCAATVDRRAPAADTASTPSQQQPSMKIPAEAGKRLVLNMQLDSKLAAADTGWPDFKKEWIDITKEQAAGKGMSFATQDGEAKATGEQGTLVVVRINDYRHVTIGKRVAFGIFTGNAFIDSKVEFRDLATGKLHGERAYNTSSSAWGGVFSAMTPKQIYALADEIIGEIQQP